jgi:Domain of unknown function (DU1801)
VQNESPEVAEFIRELSHPLKPGVEQLRAAILAADDGITEKIKWKAPSFCWHGEDRVTFRLQPGNRLQLIFHRGAKVREDDFGFEDDTGLMEWASDDRAVVTFSDLDDVAAKLPPVTGLVRRWMRAAA